MKTLFNKYKKGLGFLIFFLILLSPIKSFAHDTYFLQVLIDDHKYQYMGSVVEESIVRESSHIETQVGKFGGLDMAVHPDKGDKDKDYTDYESSKSLTDDTLIFTFSPKEIKKWYGAASNNATAQDANRAYFAQENLMTGLNDALQLVNGGKPFTSVKGLINKGNELAIAINQNKKVGDFQATKGKRAFDGNMPKGITESDYVTLTNTKTKEKYEFIYRVKKGYVATSDKDKGTYDDHYKSDTPYLTWNQLMYQANYAFTVKGYTVKTGQELAKPGPVEEAVVGLLGNAFTQLRNLLGLYEINDLVFNDGIRGSSAWTHGIMSKQWSDQALAYHWLFQALAWSLIMFAIVKNLVQRNFATINPAMKISLMENVQNLLITGFLLANAVPVMNMLMFLNAKLVAVFASTAPNFSDLAGLNAYSNLLGGVLIQIFYLGVSIYLNFVYIMRAITVAILIATAPMFIVSIAFGGKWKQLFNTWMREFVGNVFLQSFHAFMLSFFFSVATSSRGIESMIVTLSLIPMTEFFRSLVMGQGGGISHSMGMKSMAQAGSLVGGALATASGGKKNTGSSKTESSSGRESTTSSGGDNLAGNSDKIRSNSESMNQRQRMKSTKETMGNREMPLTVATDANHPDASRFKSEELQTAPANKLEKAINRAQAITDGAKNSSITKGAGGVVKGALGATKMAVGLGVGLAMGMENPKLASSAMRTASEGFAGLKGGLSQTGSAIADGTQPMREGMSNAFKDKFLPSSTQAYATTLPNGDMQVHRSARQMADEGIVGATMEGSGRNQLAKYTYDMNKLDQGERTNLQHVMGGFQTGNADAIAHYKSQGIENVTKSANGNFVVRYNQTGMDKMGIKSVQTVGASGSNARIVETKSADAPNTLRTIPVQRYQPTQTSTNTGNQTSNN